MFSVHTQGGSSGSGVAKTALHVEWRVPGDAHTHTRRAVRRAAAAAAKRDGGGGVFDVTRSCGVKTR